MTDENKKRLESILLNYSERLLEFKLGKHLAGYLIRTGYHEKQHDKTEQDTALECRRKSFQDRFEVNVNCG